ncbi:MAG: gamma-glutamyl-gamma-aminobutyrate hydrolase family protein [Alphaproteobacteria bacterium]|nr:gamma-glutamyl-gamma-aminobutyrate hydrolase family protein [Alphaproteobacteria bacterium]
MRTSSPVIGFTLDYEESGGYSKYPWYAIRDNYCAAVAKFGATPIALPHEVAQVPQYLELLDGLIITGGNFDVPPEMYGDTSTHEKVTLKRRRTEFEWAITKGALERKMPIFGICGGEQLLNVILGGTLIQHIPDSIENALPHEQPNPRHEVGHEVRIEDDTLLKNIIGTSTIAVNSAHHQAVAKVAANALVNSYAPDGVIEGLELPTHLHPFCLGVQWHPEFLITDADAKLFAAFVTAARNYHG